MRRARGLLFLVLVVVSVGTIDGLIPTVSTLQAAPPQRTIRMIQDLQYYDGPGAERGLHSFDLYLPEGKTNFPMLFFIHGGGWRGGDKVYDGLDKIAKICADLGIGVMSPNYRLSPAIRHPVHMQDVARAFAWLHQNGTQYGADPNKIFVAGGSAGGHLAALLALDERYLKEHGLSPKMIQGVMLFSGIYDLPNYRMPDGKLGQIAEVAFGPDYEVLKSASPAAHVGRLQSDTPPFFIAYTDNDLFGLAEQAKTLYSLFLQHGLRAELLEQPGRTHPTKTSGIWERLDGADDVLGAAIDRFLRSVMDGSFLSTTKAVWSAKGAADPPMRVLRDIQYDPPAGEPKFQALDLYLPEGKENFPLVFYVHGGGWRAGDKGTPTTLVNTFGRLGMGVASVNYRLSPQVKHPGHIQDVARAFSWVYQNASQYKIDRDRIVVLGTSAGGHLVSLLSLNTEYLSREGVPSSAIKGVVSISGIYNLDGWGEPGLVPTRKEVAFGTDSVALKQASPVSYLKADTPPFLITFTDWDLFQLREEALEMYHAMLGKGAPVELVQVPGRTHYDQMDGIGKRVSGVNDVLGLAVTRFVVNAVKAAGTSDYSK